MLKAYKHEAYSKTRYHFPLKEERHLEDYEVDRPEV